MRRDGSGKVGLGTLVLLIIFGTVTLLYFYQAQPAIRSSSDNKGSILAVGLRQANSHLVLNGGVLARATSASVANVTFSVSVPLYSGPIDMTGPSDRDSDGIADSTNRNTCVVSYVSNGIVARDLYWTKTQLGRQDEDDLLEAGEQFQITVDLTGVGEAIGSHHTFTIEMTPPVGQTLTIRRTVPPSLSRVMTLR